MTHYVFSSYPFLTCKNNSIIYSISEGVISWIFIFYSSTDYFLLFHNSVFYMCGHKGMKALYETNKQKILSMYNTIQNTAYPWKKTDRHISGPRIKDTFPYENYKNILKDREGEESLWPLKASWSTQRMTKSPSIKVA